MTAEEQPRDHVRRPDLPWRTATLTECGLQAATVKSCIDNAELQARVRVDGKRRTAYSTCITCLETAARWPAFAEDPVQALSREVYAMRGNPQLAAELRALAALAGKYHDEFEDFLNGLQATVSLSDRRRAHGLRQHGLHGGGTSA
ncbi:MAG: hypothetical protein ABWY93_04835 [Mycobacterium sp.]